MSQVPVVETAAHPLPESSMAALGEIVAALASRRAARFGREGAGGPRVEPSEVAVLAGDVVTPGRPGLLSVVARIDGQRLHTVLGLRSPGDEVQFLADADEAPLGILEDRDGLAVVFDALGDAELTRLLLAALTGEAAHPARVARGRAGEGAVTLVFEDRVVLTVFQRLPAVEAHHPGVDLAVALDEVGFNHLRAPRLRWCRGEDDLGVVLDDEPGGTGGWALALTSLRDLYAARTEPEHAGGDFAPEARALGVMAARMHLCLDEAFGRRPGDVDRWVAEVEAAVRQVDPGLLDDPEVASLLADLRAARPGGAAIRTHGDFHLGRVMRTDVGWIVLDFSPGGAPLGAGAASQAGPVFRSPLADVSDMLWSFHHVAGVAATERDPTGRLGLSELARAWETRNRRAFLAGYLSTPGIGGLVPASRDVVRELAAAFELERSAVGLAVRA